MDSIKKTLTNDQNFDTPDKMRTALKEQYRHVKGIGKKLNIGKKDDHPSTITWDTIRDMAINFQNLIVIAKIKDEM